jgi:diguanylate cyclase (GGDEF)-like protein
MLLYIYAPVGIRLQVALAAMTLVAYCLITFTYFSTSEPRFLYGLSYMLLSNSFGLTLSYYVNHNLRLNWARDQQRQQDMLSLQQEVERRTLLEEELKKQALTDPLTGVNNRRSFVKSLEREISMSDRHQTSMSLITFDVDHFKSINDQYGHDVGDQVLIALAQHIPKQLRSTDIFARIGGEEFAIILPGANLSQAQKIAENICHSIRTLKIPAREQTLSVTSSFGSVEHASGESSQMLLKRVDICMYRAKENGRDRVEAA